MDLESKLSPWVGSLLTLYQTSDGGHSAIYWSVEFIPHCESSSVLSSLIGSDTMKCLREKEFIFLQDLDMGWRLCAYIH